MDEKLIMQAEDMRQTAERLVRVGLIITSASLSPANRRAAFALQCLVAEKMEEPEPEPERRLIGFSYPNVQ